ncbi:MAG: ribose 5-phosphate isomerase B [Opitutales bacterium]|nr:ribose 5-phosphate isomerase B [Opitutales bacterium]
MKNILIVCTGNICRSPLIAAILDHEIIKSGLPGSYKVSSAGTFAEIGEPANTHALEAAKSLGLNISNHRAQQLTKGIIAATDLILCATEEHKEYILTRFSNAYGKCFTIADCISAKEDISDPYGEPLNAYLTIADKITRSAPHILNFIRRFFTKISIGCDHNGYQLAKQIIQDFHNHKIIAHLPDSLKERVDYPDYAWQVTDDIVQKRADFGILICKSGIGMSIAANKSIGIRAALCNTPELAKITRLHNDANVLCLGSMFVSRRIAHEMIEVFISTEFEHGRHEKRIKKISNFEKNHYA